MPMLQHRLCDGRADRVESTGEEHARRKTRHRSCSQVQHADQREEPPRRVEVDLHAIGEPFAEQLRAFVVKGASSHVDRFDARGTCSANRIEVARADEKLVLDDAAERRERDDDAVDCLLVATANLEHKAIVLDAEMHMKGTRCAAAERETVLFEEIENRDGALMLYIRIAAYDRALVEGDLDDALIGLCHQRRGRLSLSAIESA